MGTAEDAATANDSGTLSRSEQISENWRQVNSKLAPSDKSVAVTSKRGRPACSVRSPKVLP